MNRVQIQLLKECTEALELGSVKFTEWEEEFISSLGNMAPDCELSVKQNAIINKLSTRAQQGY